jgi:hypothetical protein
MPDYAPESKPASEMVLRPIWSILSLGVSGAGKSIASCGKEFRPVYVFNCEGRFESVINYYMKLDGHVNGIFYNDYNVQDSNAWFSMKQKMKAIQARPEYKTVSVATLTSFDRIVMKHLINSTKIESTKQKGGIEVNNLEDFNYNDAALIFELVGFFQSLKVYGVNTILEAHVTPYEVVDKIAQKTHTNYEVLAKGKKAPAEIPSWFNEVWLFERISEGFGKPDTFVINPKGDSNHKNCKTSFGITPFNWTGIDPTPELISQLSPELRNTPRVDPNAPKRLSF